MWVYVSKTWGSLLTDVEQTIRVARSDAQVIISQGECVKLFKDSFRGCWWFYVKGRQQSLWVFCSSGPGLCSKHVHTCSLSYWFRHLFGIIFKYLLLAGTQLVLRIERQTHNTPVLGLRVCWSRSWVPCWSMQFILRLRKRKWLLLSSDIKVPLEEVACVLTLKESLPTTRRP